MSTEAKKAHHVCTNLPFVSLEQKSAQNVIEDMDLSNLSNTKRKPFIETVVSHLNTFQTNLSRYNHAYRPIFASFEWVGKTRLTPIKLWAPDYSSHGAMLFNIKCQQLIEKGVLISPTEHYIQPITTNNI